MTDERLRDLYARGLQARAARGTGADVADVSPDDLLALAEGTLPEERRLELFDVVMASEALSRDFALVRAAVVAARQSTTAAADDGGADEDGDTTPPDVVSLSSRRAADRSTAAPWWRRFAGPLAIAASLLVVVLVGRYMRPVPEEAGVMRGADDGIALVAPAMDAAPADARHFVWHPVPEAARYTFELVDPDGTLVYQTTTADTTLTLPADVTLRPTVEYRWLLRATDAAATPRATAVRRLQVSAP